MTDRPGTDRAVDLDAPLWPDAPENLPAVTHLYPAGPDTPAQQPARPPHPLPPPPLPPHHLRADRDTRRTAARAAPAPRTSPLLRPEDYLTEPHEPPQTARPPQQAVTAAGAGRGREGGPGRDRTARPSRDSGSRNKIIIAVAAVAAVVGAGGTVLGIGTSRHDASLSGAAQRSSHGATAPPSHGATAPPSHGATAPPSSSTGPGDPPIVVRPGVPQDLAAMQVVKLLTSYFTAINSHDYTTYQALIDPQMQQQITEPRFASGYRTTTDSGVTLTGISTVPDGRTTANVTFTSHQNPSDSPDHSSCTNWSIRLFLEQSGGGGYLIGPAAAGYQASHQPC